MPPSSALPQTLKSITAVKIDEVSKVRSAFEGSRARVSRSVARKEDLLNQFSRLLRGSCEIEGVQLPSGSKTEIEDISASTNHGEDLKNMYRFLRQAKIDPSFPKDRIQHFKSDLERRLELQSVKHEHILFFSRLVTEWLDELDQPLPSTKQPSPSEKPTEDSSSFENVGRKEMQDQRAEWEHFVFDIGEDPDADTIVEYLDKLFKSNKNCRDALEVLKSGIEMFCDDLEYNPPDFQLSEIVDALLTSDLLGDEKKAILKEFVNNKQVAKEVSEVLTLKLQSITSWQWSQNHGAISLDIRRQLNGKYRVYMDEDVLDALLLQHLGGQWAMKFKAVFQHFLHSSAWKRNARSKPKKDRESRQFFLGEDSMVIVNTKSLPTLRSRQYLSDYFMTQLPSYESPKPRPYDNDDASDTYGRYKVKANGPLDVKHSLLHLLITEALIARQLHGEQTIIRSDLRWFGPSLPHTTIFTILKYFGVTKTWLDFFEKFLSAPMRFNQDGPGGQVRERKRGVPMSHTLSDVFGEVTLFCMDFAVNQHTDGQFLYRLHDDFWFWGKKSTCQLAWRAMSEFTESMGLQFNEEKTGSVSLGPLDLAVEGDSKRKYHDEDVNNATASQVKLPSGDVRWGFLKLDAATSRFIIDQSKVDEHIIELQRQLAAQKSVFSWVQAYNSYLARFFSNNFGKPAHCFGRAHLDDMISTHARIQHALFPSGTVTDYLQERISKEFGVKDLPVGFFYFPVEVGGLGLKSPFVPLFTMRENLCKTAEEMLQLALERDVDTYAQAKERFVELSVGTRGLGKHSNPTLSQQVEDSVEGFISPEEFHQYREETSINLSSAYRDLLCTPNEKQIHRPDELAAALEQLPRHISLGGISPSWGEMEPYWKWMTALYCAEMVKKFGSLTCVDPSKIPLGVLLMLKAGKVQWQG
ncbi:hypothetical protein UCRPC4_g03424 [Phaeomoniella chlamydospora]|uniref:Reverse transcriptase n=1 Tax=Phaeomoniella chlamydospora TaxID=158046 RepID=A0A0G2EI95_PHACM|nr:hypothetical protein UCRPC4_g03424 [Phaeomoniella chlamydospora]